MGKEKEKDQGRKGLEVEGSGKGKDRKGKLREGHGKKRNGTERKGYRKGYRKGNIENKMKDKCFQPKETNGGDPEDQERQGKKRQGKERQGKEIKIGKGQRREAGVRSLTAVGLKLGEDRRQLDRLAVLCLKLGEDMGASWTGLRCCA